MKLKLKALKVGDYVLIGELPKADKLTDHDLHLYEGAVMVIEDISAEDLYQIQTFDPFGDKINKSFKIDEIVKRITRASHPEYFL